VRTSDVIVVGGGVIGASVAYHLARAGVSVTLCERDGLAAHASGAAAGMLAPICEAVGAGPFLNLGLRSLALTPGLVRELAEVTDVDPQYRPSGVLRAALSEADAAHLRSREAWLSAWDVEWLDSAGARRREPGLPETVQGALWSPREAHVYSPQFARALGDAAARRGARLELGTQVTGLIRDGERVLGVETAGGQFGAGHVVLCAGAWSRFCGEWLGEALAVEPVRGQIVALEAPLPQPASILWSEAVYLVPKANGTVIAGATEERAGFDCRTTAAGVRTLLAAAEDLLPALAGCGFRAAWAGLRPATPDGLPLLGPLRGVEGLSLATGHFRNGVLLAAATGELLTGWITRHEWPAAAAAFLPDRFTARG
jgi:glycine oxidase